MLNKSIPLTITKYYDGTECTYTLTKVTPSHETTVAIEACNNNVLFENIISKALFENIIDKYFILGPKAKCTEDDIKALLWKQAVFDNALFVGFVFMYCDLQYCEHYKAFLKYITSLDGVKETRFRDNGLCVRGYKGIGIRDI